MLDAMRVVSFPGVDNSGRLRDARARSRATAMESARRVRRSKQGARLAAIAAAAKR